MKLYSLRRDGWPDDPTIALPDVAKEVVETFARMYEAVPYEPPWTGYLAGEEDGLVGTCAFKGPPVDGRVEIAYFTFPGCEGRGVATRMARGLVEIALASDPKMIVTAQTLPEPNASNHLLQKLGFGFSRSLEHPEDGLVWEWVYRKPASG